MLNEIRAWLVSKPLFTLYHAVRRDGVLPAISDLEASQWFSADQLHEMQLRKLNLLLAHAVKNVPYYRAEITRHLPEQADFSDYEAFRKLPFLTKEAVRTNLKSLIADNADQASMVLNSTSGSTGEPMRFYNDKRSMAWQQAVVWRNQAWVHALYSDREARLWGAQMDIQKSARLRQRLHAWLHQTLLLSSYDLSDESMARYLDQLQKYRPRLLVSYPGALSTFCEYLDKSGARIPGIKAVITSAEQLHDWQRELIERVLGVEVFDRYGCREFGNIAHECDKHEGYHLNAERFFVEILDDNGFPVTPGEIGNLYVTDLDNHAFPFIRYAIGDRAVMASGNCSCGRGLPLIKAFEGRVLDVVRCPNGNRLGGTFWTIALRRIQGLHRFQVVQWSPDDLTIKLVMNSDMRQADESVVRKLISEKCGAEMKIQFEYVKEIPLGRSGKEKLVTVREFN